MHEALSLEALLTEHGSALPLDLACIALAQEEDRRVSADTVIAGLDTLASRIRIPEGATLYESVARVNHRLFTECGFHGDHDEYDDPVNSRIDQVLARKQGLPILLSVVYIEVARRAGLDIVGIGFPGHFLVRPRVEEPRFFIDPFNTGRILKLQRLVDRLQRMTRGAPLDADQVERYTRPVDPRFILIRINNNLKGSYLRRQDIPGALRATERLKLLAPELVDEWRESGWMKARLGHTDDAIDDLEQYLLRAPEAEDRDRIVAELAVLKHSRG